jgi:hypothetical protein
VWNCDIRSAKGSVAGRGAETNNDGNGKRVFSLGRSFCSTEAEDSSQQSGIGIGIGTGTGTGISTGISIGSEKGQY